MKLRNSVYLEGPNGGGKSTLLASLVELGLPSDHSGGPKKDADEVFDVLRRVEAANAVVDRYPLISEVAYDRALKREPNVPHASLYMSYPVEPPLVIYCRPSTDVLFAHEPHDGETHPPEHRAQIVENRRRLVQTYDELMMELSSELLIRLVLYDWTSGVKPGKLVDVMRAAGDLCVD